MKNKYLLLLENLVDEVSTDVKILFNLDKLSDAEIACFDVYNDFDQYEVDSQSLSIRNAWKEGEKISIKLQEMRKK